MTKRWNSLDCLKGLSCLAVVLIHYNFPGNLGLAVKAACRFAVPVFFCVSGFFLAPNQEISEVKLLKKLRHILKILLASGLFYAFFAVAWNVVTNPAWNWKQFSGNTLLAPKIVKFFLTNDPFLYSHLWFMLALVYSYAAILLFCGGKRQSRLTGLFAVVLLIAYSCIQEFGGLLHIQRSLAIPGTDVRVYLFNLFIFRALPFILFGMVMRRHEAAIARLPLRKPLLIALMLLGCCLSIAERFLVAEAQYFVGSYITVAAMFVLAIKEPDWGGRVLSYIGRELSLYVYVLHIAVGQVVNLFLGVLRLWQTPVSDYGRAFMVLTASLIAAWVLHLMQARLTQWRQSRLAAR